MPDTEDRIGEALRRIVRSLDVHSRSLLREHQLTGPQLAVLRALANVGTAPVGSIAKAAHLGAPTVTGIIDRLERQQLVRRIRSQEDRRQVMVAATDLGLKLIEQRPSPLNNHLRAKLALLEDWERLQILATLQRVATMMEASGDS